MKELFCISNRIFILSFLKRFCTTPDSTVKIDTVFQDEIIRLIQKKMAELFDVKNAQPS
jgi:hypothetical protein